MSVGKDKHQRLKKTQGWEEAGSEFYQESYPGDLENSQRDQDVISTLLPSKQNRAATTRRVRPTLHDTKNSRHSQQQYILTDSRRHSISCRESQTHEVHVSMLPDLSQGLTDEERIWEEIHEIKSMPVSMAQKKELKAQLQNATKLRLQGFDQIKWQRRKAWQQFKTKWIEVFSKAELWRSSLKRIEGNFGTGVVAYFLFLRWLMFLNLFIFMLILMFVVTPHLILREPVDQPCNQIMEQNSTQCCNENYLNKTTDSLKILDIFQGTGFMEKTLIFYGMYTNKIFGYNEYKSPFISNSHHTSKNLLSHEALKSITLLVNEEAINASESNASSKIQEEFTNKLYYNLPLAYVTVTVVYFLISLIAIVKAASREFKDRLVDGEGQFYQYCNLVFGGWDFCIHNEKSSSIKHKALCNEIKGLLHSKRMEYERCNRSREFMCRLIVIRLTINFFVIIILALSASIIYFLFNISLQHLELHSKKSMIHKNSMHIDSKLNTVLFGQNNLQLSSYKGYISGSLLIEPINGNEITSKENKIVPELLEEQLTILFFEFLPSIAIVCLNLLIPILFNYLCKFERYSPMFVIKISLFRTIFLRLSSLAVLLSRFYFLVIPKTGNQCYHQSFESPQCWETFVGQQFYKLVITDFVTHLFVTFFVNFPRSVVAKHLKTKFARLLGEQEFELSKHVLDIVYSQTLCWLGAFYAPLLPAISTILTFFMFYIKKFQCLINSKPSGILYRASRSNSLFMFILLVSYVIAVVPVVYAIAEIMPSRSCGPFRGLNSVWDAAILGFMKLPSFIQNLIFFLGTAGFAIPCFIILTLFLYYYSAVSDANKHMVEVLKNQLVLEGHDKQFLLNRLSSFIKQQQENKKKARKFERSGSPTNRFQQNQQSQNE